MASLEIIKLEWATPIFKVVEHSQDGLYILFAGSGFMAEQQSDI